MPPLSPEIQPGEEVTATAGEDRILRWYATREPLVLVVLSLMAVLFFLAVTGLSRIYYRQQDSLGERWYSRGVADLNAGHADQAVGAFHAALRYSRDNYGYQLSLAQALAALNRTDEAQAYLLNLWERKPEDGTVTLELGRIFVKKREKDQALRYYHNAIYATWADHPDNRRRAARLELVDFLLQENDQTQAQAELIALAANLPPDSPLHLRIGGLFMQVQDYEHALQQYREALTIDRRSSAAMAGAGHAAFVRGNYESAQGYLAGAVAGDPKDTESAELLHTAGLVLQMDPFRRQISASKRSRIVIEAFETAGARLKSCSPRPESGATVPTTADQETLDSRWNDLKPRITELGLRRDPDLVDSAMDLVFAIERQTRAECGGPAGADLALLLISKLHGGN